MMMAFYHFPFWGHRLGASAGWRDGGAVFHLTHWMAAEIDGMALWRLGARCAVLDSRRRRLLFGVMVTSMAEWPDKVEASI